MRRFAIPVAVMLLLVLAVPVSAAKPDKQYLPGGAVFDAGVVCPFAISLENDRSKLKSIVFNRRDGRYRENQSGQLFIRVTNLETGQSVVRQSSGPAKFSVNDAGHLVITLGGSSLFPFYA